MSEESHDELMRRSLEELEAIKEYQDESAATHVYRADVGFNTGAWVEGFTTSPQILINNHWHRWKNANPEKDSSEYPGPPDELIAQVYGYEYGEEEEEDNERSH